MKALKTALICRCFFSWRQRQHTCTHSLHHTGAEQKVLTEWWKNHYAASSVISQHHAERTAMLSPLTRGGGPRESGLTPLTNTSATVCVCVCIPVVIITQIRAEPNPHRVFSPNLAPLLTALPSSAPPVALVLQSERGWEAEQPPWHLHHAWLTDRWTKHWHMLLSSKSQTFQTLFFSYRSPTAQIKYWTAVDTAGPTC